MKLILLFVTLSWIFPCYAVELVVGAAGDLSFSDNHLRDKNTPPDVSPYEVWDQSGKAPFSSLTVGVRDLFWESDVNFLNLESVVASSKQGLSISKETGYAFLSHPAGIRHLIEDMNVNLFSLANNHTNDFGEPGKMHTLKNISDLEREFNFAHSSGIFRSGRPFHPTEFRVGDKKVAFAAIGLNRESGTRLKSPGYRSDSDFKEIIKAFRSSNAHLKILSIHYGTEGQVDLDSRQRDRYRYAVDYGGVNLILGHHPHVVRPIEIYKGAAIFYSFGNFLITGARNIDGDSSDSKNYGLFSRVYFDISKNGAEVTAIEAYALKGMHWKPKLASPRQGAGNIFALNHVSEQLNGTGVRFGLRKDGSGVYCSGRSGGPRSRRICD